MSVMVTMVLLNVDWMCAMPVGDVLADLLLLLGPCRCRRVLVVLVVLPCCLRALRLMASAGAALARAPLQHALARALARARVGVRALAAHRQPLR